MIEENCDHWIVGTGFSRGIGFELLKILKHNHWKVIHLGRTKTGFEDEFIPWDLSVHISKNPKESLLKKLSHKNIVGFFYAAGMMPPLSSRAEALSSRAEALSSRGLTAGSSHFDDHFWLAQEQAMRVNYFSCAEIVEEVLPFMRMDPAVKPRDDSASPRDDKIPFVAHLSSLAAIDPFAGLELYGGTKAAALLYFSWLSKRFDPNVLTCLSIHPGTVKTDMAKQIMETEPKDLEIVKAFQKLNTENLLMEASESADKIYAFLFQDQKRRANAHGKLYAVDREQIN